MPATVTLDRAALIRLAEVDLEEFTSLCVLSECDLECQECGDRECDGEVHFDESEYDDYADEYECASCGGCTCGCGCCTCDD